jgi:hypothetical protein
MIEFCAKEADEEFLRPIILCYNIFILCYNISFIASRTGLISLVMSCFINRLDFPA